MFLLNIDLIHIKYPAVKHLGLAINRSTCLKTELHLTQSVTFLSFIYGILGFNTELVYKAYLTLGS